MKVLRHIHSQRKFSIAIALVVAAAWMLASPAWAQDLEYEPGEGLHQEEWYDPSDWFDTDAGIDYENDWYDYTYNYPYDYDYDQDVQGYFEEDFGEEEFVYEYDYYTENWYEDEEVF